MALMEAPAIIIDVMLVQIFDEKGQQSVKIPKVIAHSFTNGSVLLILGSLIIGLLASEKQAQGIKPLTQIFLKDFWPYSY